ncbi:MAG TPA: hypothetical protein VFX51_28830 [Solirubrobacteraceae bacterium]|nr:hypothetical protein [Solirubrobacteraceae bacterium]
MRFLAPLVLLVVLAVAAPAQADVTASVITTPTSPHFVLSKGPGTKVDVSGRATGAGNVQVVCERSGFSIVLTPDVPVLADGTFEADDVSLDLLVNHTLPRTAGQTCRLRAVPAGALPGDPAPFRGPVLAVSKYERHLISTGGPNDGMQEGYYLYAAGADRGTTITGSFGDCGIDSSVLDPDTFDQINSGLACSGTLTDLDNIPVTGLKVDGDPVQPAGSLWLPFSNELRDKPGFPVLEVPSVAFDASTGAVAVTERNALAKCGPNGAFPVTGSSCAAFDPVPVKHERTTTVLAGDQVVRVVDRWSSTDGHPHRLDLRIDHSPATSPNITFRFPGETGYGRHDAGDVIAPVPAGAPVLIRDADVTQPGVVVLPLQAAGGAHFYGTEEFSLVYDDRLIPASGELTFTHYYLTTRRSDEVEHAAARLIASLAKPPAPTPHGGAGGQTVALPRFSRDGRLRVRRAGRRFRVVTRDRVTCATACVVRIGGRRLVTTNLHVAAGETKAVRFLLTRGGARKLRRAGTLRLKYVLSAPGVTTRRQLALRVSR